MSTACELKIPCIWNGLIFFSFFFYVLLPDLTTHMGQENREEHMTCTKIVQQQKDPSSAVLIIRYLSYDNFQDMSSNATCRSEDQINITSSETKSSKSLTRTKEWEPKNTRTKRLWFGGFLLLTQETQTIEVSSKQETQITKVFNLEKHCILMPPYW